jgi:hypothetical protein
MDSSMMHDSANPSLPEPQLDAVEARVLGVLIEKAALTPDTYPLTLNAVVVACNQKTSREPLMDLELGQAGHALRRLEDKGLVKVLHSPRALRYEHRTDEAYVLTPSQRALLCLMLLRGPQTLAELYARSERLAKFTGLDDVRATLARLCERAPPIARVLPRGAGQREDRYAHLLCGEPAYEPTAAATAVHAVDDDTNERIARLEQALDQLQTEVERLRARLEP